VGAGWGISGIFQGEAFRTLYLQEKRTRMRVSPQIANVHFPPISEVKRWVAERPPGGRELVDLCQAVPDYAPAPELTEHLSRLLGDPLLSKYSPDEGLPEVREAVCGFYCRNTARSCRLIISA